MNRLVWMGIAAFAVAGCAAPVDEPTSLRVSCDGKCDGFSSIGGLWKDIRELNLTDLADRGTRLATDELNDVLSTSFIGVELLEPTVAGSPELAMDNDQVEDLGRLSTNLLAQFGEGELSADVNALRLRRIMDGHADVYVESGFRIEAGIDHGFAIDGDGILENASARIGLGNGSLEGRVIHAADRDPGTTPEAILEGVRVGRDFVIPRDLDDVREMNPGEAVALRADGALGINAGLGVPIAIADPGSITYNIVISAALRAMIEGTLDVQLVRLDGDEVVVDVGTDASAGFRARLAVEDGWGAAGLVRANLPIGDYNVDLGRLVDRALQRQMNQRLNLISAELERTGEASRLSVVRVRFNVDAGTPELEDALTQALRGDVRLAQALSAQGVEGVHVDYDLLRTGLSATSRARLDLFGMSFFVATQRSEGDLRIETPGGAQELMFDTIRRERGSWFESHGHGRIALGGIRIERDTGRAETESNLFVEVLEGDRYMQRDTLLDNLDAIIVAIAGPEALSALEEHGNAVQRHVETTCNPSPAFDPCRETVLMSREVVDGRADGLAAIEAEISDLAPQLQAVVMAAANLRVASNATVEPAASFVGPTTSVAVDYRLDDASLERLLVEGRGSELRSAVLDILRATRVDREATPEEIATAREGLEARNMGALDAMETVFDARADVYERRLAVERSVIEDLGPMGARAIGITVAAEGTEVLYDTAEARTLVRDRSHAARDLFDALLDEARGLNNIPRENALGYALLRMQRQDAADVRVEIVMPLDDRFSQDFTHYRMAGQDGFRRHGRGPMARLIGGGVFDVDALIDIQGN